MATKPKVWFTVSYEETRNTVAFARLPDGASLCSFGEDDKWFFPEDPDAFVADTHDAVKVFWGLITMSRPGYVINLPVVRIADTEVGWGDIFYCLVQKKLYCESDGSPFYRLHLYKLIVG